MGEYRFVITDFAWQRTAPLLPGKRLRIELFEALSGNADLKQPEYWIRSGSG